MNPEQQFVSIEKLKEEGYSHYKINQMVSSGKLVRINKKYYENLMYTKNRMIFMMLLQFLKKE